MLRPDWSPVATPLSTRARSTPIPVVNASSPGAASADAWDEQERQARPVREYLTALDAELPAASDEREPGAPNTRLAQIRKQPGPSSTAPDASATPQNRVEPLFGQLKRNMGLRRPKLRGLHGAAEEFTMEAAAQNLMLLTRQQQAA
ncbi:MAG: transposase [Acetobacteraceae bacterium]|nr:transposase [Acetobacteraceae bacterium]